MKPKTRKPRPPRGNPPGQDTLAVITLHPIRAEISGVCGRILTDRKLAIARAVQEADKNRGHRVCVVGVLDTFCITGAGETRGGQPSRPAKGRKEKA